MPNDKPLTAADMGRKGGRSRSPEKTAAARRNAQARRGKPTVVAVRKIEQYAKWLEQSPDGIDIAIDLRRICAGQDDENDAWNFTE